MKMWQAAILHSGYHVRDIPLNEERVKYFCSKYEKDTSEYEYGFKDHYKEYLREQKNEPRPGRNSNLLASTLALGIAMSGKSNDESIDETNEAIKMMHKAQTSLPIHLRESVPEKYCKKYDKEEYLLEIYKKLGIKVIEESDYFYYIVELPETLTIVDDDHGTCIKKGDETLVHFYDRGPFYDKSVYVDKINVTL